MQLTRLKIDENGSGDVLSGGSRLVVVDVDALELEIVVSLVTTRDEASARVKLTGETSRISSKRTPVRRSGCGRGEYVRSLGVEAVLPTESLPELLSNLITALKRGRVSARRWSESRRVRESAEGRRGAGMRKEGAGREN